MIKLTLNVLLVLLVGLNNLCYAVEAGNAMPSCKVTSLDKSINKDIQKYKGKVVYVDFWASWCGPCAHSFPFLNELHQKLRHKGLQIIAINMDENTDDAMGFLEKTPANFEVVSDSTAQCAKDFDVKAMPSSFLVDRQGIVHKVHFGFRQEDTQELFQLVEKLLAQK